MVLRRLRRQFFNVTVFEQIPMIPVLARLMADAIIALSDFADKWKKLEEAKLKQ